ncbi:44670_t:CDS:1, partial [Gigaspora margarita]
TMRQKATKTITKQNSESNIKKLIEKNPLKAHTRSAQKVSKKEKAKLQQIIPNLSILQITTKDLSTTKNNKSANKTLVPQTNQRL